MHVYVTISVIALHLALFSIYEESLYETYITDIYNIILYIQNPVRFASSIAVRHRMTKLIEQ
jgi:hypothetical protein